MRSHPGVLITTGLAVFSFTVAAALTSPEVPTRQPTQAQTQQLKQKIENLERAHDALEKWADRRLVPWVNRVANLQQRLAKAVGVAVPTAPPVPSVPPLPVPPDASVAPPAPSVPPVPIPPVPTPSCVLIPISNVCIGDPSPPPHP